MSSAGLLGACKTQKKTNAPLTQAQATKEESQQPDPADPQAALKKQLSREALDGLRPFDFEQGRLKGQAFLVKAPEVEALKSGGWVITGEYGPEGTEMECLIESSIASMGEKMGGLLELALGGSEQIGGYQTSAGESFVRQSKYAGLSQIVVYKFKHDPTAVGFYTVVSTHGDTWTMTCGADSPGYFKTMFTAARKLADSITVKPDENTWVPAEYAIYEIKVGERRIGLQEHYLYRFKKGESADIVSVSIAAGKPNVNFQVRSQFHVKTFRNNKFSKGWVGSHTNGAPDAEFAYEQDAKSKGIRVKQFKGQEVAERVDTVGRPILPEAQIKDCFRAVLAGKNKQCKYSSGMLSGTDFSLVETLIKLKDKKERLFTATAKDMRTEQWMDTNMDSTRSRIEVAAGGNKVVMDLVRIWPEVKAE